VGVAVGAAAPPPGPLRLRFLTPVALRQGETAHAEPAGLIKSVANRVTGLALWQGAALALDGPALGAEAEALGAGAEWRGARLRRWTRGSAAQGRRMAMARGFR
jgi:hypothetical protein